MPLRNVFLGVFAVLVAAVCVRLGVWQLDRREQRRARNALAAARLAAAPVPVATLAADTAALRYRRVTVEGRPDYEHEVVLSNRVHEGSPGVNILTPVRLPGRDTAVLVNRGWVYSPDGSRVALARWREGETLAVTGYVEPLVRDASAAPQGAAPRLLRRADAARIAALVPYPVRPYYVVALPDPRRPDTHATTARLAPPALDEGPHLGYAFQWFAFGTMALGITGLVLWRGTGGGQRGAGSGEGSGERSEG